MTDILTYSKFIKTKLSVYLREAIQNNNAEFEIIFGEYGNKNIIQKTEFLNLFNNLKQLYDFSESNSLDIRLNKKYDKSRKQTLSSIRCTIEGIKDIKQYCKTGSINDLTNIHFMNKSYYNNPKTPDLKFNSVLNREYNLRVNLKKEENLSDLSSDVMEFKHNFDNDLKYYRYKKRYSFITEDKLFRIDLTAVKSSESIVKRGSRDYKLSKNLIESGILGNKETFELEIEYIGSDSIDDEKPIDIFISKIYDSYNESLFKSKKTKNVLNDYVLNEPEDYVYQFDDDFSSDDEITEKIDNASLLFPSVFSPITVDIMENINEDYWKESDREWLFNELIINERSLYFVDIRKNTKGDYKNSPINTDYIEFRITPDFEYDEIQENENFPKKFNNNILIPLEYINGSSEYHQSSFTEPNIPKLNYKLPSWAPKKIHKDKDDKKDQKDKDDKEYVPEPIPEKIEKIEPIQFQDLLEAGEFDEDLKVQEKIWESKLKQQEDYNKKGYGDQSIVDELLILLNKLLYELFIIIHKTDLLVSNTKKEEIIKYYRTLTEQTTKKTFFLGPNPVSLSLNELNPSNINSILKGYVVTEKADGIRSQLLIAYNECYLITQKLQVIDTGLKCENITGMWLFDGEYITKNKQGGDDNLFMIFDVYYAGDGMGIYPNHAYTYPWLNMKRSKKEINRSSIISDFKNKASFVPKSESNFNLKIGYKTYYEGPKTLKQSKKDTSKYTNISKMGQMSHKILNKDENEDGYGYRIDGLIFLPMFLSVNSTVEGEIRKLGNYNNKNNPDGRWDLNYKWKPPDENSIDFKVKIVQETIKNKLKDKITTSIINGKSVKCKQLELYVGYKYYEDPDFDYVWKILTDSYEKTPFQIRFNPDNKNDKYLTNIPITGETIICQRDNVEIKNDMILEMSYNPQNPIDSLWQPLRHRDDKIFPNKFTTANSVWNTIQNPVTNEFIIGKNLDQIDDLLSESMDNDEEGYYKDFTKFVESDIPLRELHNLIKNKLISSLCSVGNKPISIMDTSIGRGGDIKKFLSSKNKIEFIFGLDISSDVKRKAAERYYNENMKKPKAFFLQYDTGESILKGEGYQGSDSDIERNKIIMNILLDRKVSIPKEFNSIKKEYKGLISKGFDIISSQFTIHYYFETEQKLRNYLQNLSDHCKPNGYFIGTCYDGMKVYNLLKDKDNVSMFDDFENKVYSITRDYEIDNFSYIKDDLTNVLGQKIKVEMSSIGHEITEYLVNFEFFIDIMKEYNFELVSPDLKGKFSGIFDNKDLSYKKGLGGFEQIIKKLPNMSSKDMSIRKFYPESLNILKEENIPLQQLSALNNWFIFQKKE